MSNHRHATSSSPYSGWLFLKLARCSTGQSLPGRSQPQNPLAESKTISANGSSSRPTRVGAERLLAANRTSAAHPMTIVADLRDAPQQLLSAEIDIPVKPGPFTFTAALWTLGTQLHLFRMELSKSRPESSRRSSMSDTSPTRNSSSFNSRNMIWPVIDS